MLEIDLTLPNACQVEEVGELPGTGKFKHPIVFFPPPKDGRERTSLWLRFSVHDGETWIGAFAFGYPSPPAFCRVVSTPDPNRVCVISNGAGYLVSVQEPTVWEKIPLIPILDVRPVPARGMLILSDLNRLVAYGSNGLIWRSPQVCWDELKILDITNHSIEGTGYDPTNSNTHEKPFAVDLKTGASLLPSPLSADGKPIW